jgi:serine/threonine protein phosphatase 1
MRTFVIGDIHGAFKALKQVLERSGFDYENDKLITIGDIVDGWGQSYECVEELLKVKNRIDIHGNHDHWFLEFLMFGIHPVRWEQGGLATAKSYGVNVLGEHFKYHSHPYGNNGRIENYYTTNLLNSDIPQTHLQFFKNQVRSYKDDKKRLFIHGGFNRHYPLNEQYKDDIYWWDRDLWMGALSAESSKMKYKIAEEVSHVYIGHTQTTNWGKDYPMTAVNITNVDTGAGWNGKLSMQNIETGEVFQSDKVMTLYPDEKGRN